MNTIMEIFLFLEISGKHAPFKTMRLKRMSDRWISTDMVKLMYEGEHVNKSDTNNKDPMLYLKYKRLRKQLTEIRKKHKHVVKLIPKNVGWN